MLEDSKVSLLRLLDLDDYYFLARDQKHSTGVMCRFLKPAISKIPASSLYSIKIHIYTYRQ